ncbi:MFS transporter [Prauserella marina]|uniref:MFS transporter, YNFM family, putative membrane transport protein n=2 Tax=Prauserella marina TaxID=530584 RepID=A0A222VK51_9PSEU|nr:MFS transporter [Prauserella marina]PWV71914.1 YNFM family putative membrane transporter [Prauserella marina]SDD90737.1 MFS transporter, YNFM family, putative membrane transport protein [Prauserella marina]
MGVAEEPGSDEVGAEGRSTVRRTTVAMTAAGICSFALLYAPQPVLPQLADQFALGPGKASLAISVATGALALAVLPIAVLSEVVGRRPIIVASVLASALLGLLLPFAPSFEVLLVLRVLQGVAIAGFPGVAAAYLVEQLGKAGVAAAVGAMIAGNTVGGMSGRLVSGFTTDWLGWHGALAAVAAVSLACALLTVVTLPHPPAHIRKRGSFAIAKRQQSSLAHERRRGGRLRSVLGGLGEAVRKPVLLAQYAVGLLGMGAFVGLYNAAGFRLTGEPLDLSPAIASLVFLAYAMGAVSSVTSARLVARFGRRRSQLAALAVTAAGAAMTLPDSLPFVIAGFLVLTAGFFAVHSIANGWTAVEAPEHARGQASGLYTLAYYLGSSIGGTLGSVVYGSLGWPVLIATVGGWLAAAAVASTLATRTSSPAMVTANAGS